MGSLTENNTQAERAHHNLSQLGASGTLSCQTKRLTRCTTDGWNKHGISMKQQLTFVARTSGWHGDDRLLTLSEDSLLVNTPSLILSKRTHKNTPTMNFNKNILIALAMMAVSSSAFAPPQSAHRAIVMPKKTSQSITTHIRLGFIHGTYSFRDPITYCMEISSSHDVSYRVTIPITSSDNSSKSFKKRQVKPLNS